MVVFLRLISSRRSAFGVLMKSGHCNIGVILKYISNNSYKAKLEECGMNPLPSDYEADMLTI